jgi:hypothetical protein
VTQGGVTKRRFGGNARAATGPVAEASGMIDKQQPRLGGCRSIVVGL